MKNLILTFCLFPLALFAKEIPDSEKLHVHFISGSNEYKSEASLKPFQEYLEKNYPVTVTASWVKDGASDLPEVDSIEKADVLLVFARRLKLPEDQEKKVTAHWEADKGIVGIRTASHAFSSEINKVFDKQIMGGNYDGHFGDEAVSVTAVDDAEHPALAEVGDFTSKKLYKAKELASTATLLQNGTIKLKSDKVSTHPVTWSNTFGENGRSFYTSLGVPSDFEDENFRRMIVQSIFWAAHLEAPAFVPTAEPASK